MVDKGRQIGADGQTGRDGAVKSLYLTPWESATGKGSHWRHSEAQDQKRISGGLADRAGADRRNSQKRHEIILHPLTVVILGYFAAS